MASKFRLISKTAPAVQPSDQESPALKKAVNIATQIPLGVAKRYTWPADFLKASAYGAALDELRNQYIQSVEEGSPFDYNTALKALQESMDYFPTQESAEKFLESKTGAQLRPQDEISKFIRTSSELASFSPGSSIGRKAIAGASGAAAEKGLEKAGVPEPLAALGGAGVAGIAGAGKPSIKAATPEVKQVRDIAQKHELPLKKFMEKDARGLQPVITPAKKISLEQELKASTDSAINRMIEKNIPASRLANQGYNLESAYTKAFDMAEQRAKNLTNKVQTDKITDYLLKKYREIKSRGPALSTQSKKGQSFIKEKYKELSGKELTPPQLIKQYRELNRELDSLYRKPEFSGAEKQISEIVEGMKKEVGSLLQHSAGKSVYDPFRFGNSIYHQSKKIQQTQNILKKVLEKEGSPQNLSKVLGNDSKRKFLERNLGAHAVSDLEEIAKYSDKYAQKLGKFKEKDILSFEKLGSHYLLRMIPLIGRGLSSALISKETLGRARGYLLSQEGPRKTYLSMLKAAVEGDEAFVKRSADQLNQMLSNNVEGWPQEEKPSKFKLLKKS